MMLKSLARQRWSASQPTPPAPPKPQPEPRTPVEPQPGVEPVPIDPYPKYEDEPPPKPIAKA